jgi:UDP-N-acetylglucosamine--N-acetylmuramyl-(pentapeptide) pyrophosphoryl-undecaprenol N-acetylglucosamine transferase
VIKPLIETSHLPNIQIIHQTGSNESTHTLQNFYARNQIQAHVFSYDSALEKYYAVADVIICRSGAGTLFEILACNKKCITIPLESVAQDHQVANALACAQQYPENVRVLRQSDIQKNPSLFAQTITRLLNTF